MRSQNPIEEEASTGGRNYNPSVPISEATIFSRTEKSWGLCVLLPFLRSQFFVLIFTLAIPNTIYVKLSVIFICTVIIIFSYFYVVVSNSLVLNHNFLIIFTRWSLFHLADWWPKRYLRHDWQKLMVAHAVVSICQP